MLGKYWSASEVSRSILKKRTILFWSKYKSREPDIIIFFPKNSCSNFFFPNSVACFTLYNLRILSKVQLISKCPFGVFKSSKKNNVIFSMISVLGSRKRPNQKIGALYNTKWRILFWPSYTTFMIWPLFRG